MTRSYSLALFLFSCYSCVGSFHLIFIHMHTLYYFEVLDVCDRLVCVCLCQIPTPLHGLWILPLKPTTTIYLTYNQIRNHWTQRNKNSHSHYANTVNIYSIEKYNYAGFWNLSFFLFVSRPNEGKYFRWENTMHVCIYSALQWRMF